MSRNNNLTGGLFPGESLTIKETALSAQIAQYLNLRKIYNDRINSGKVEAVKKYFCKKTNIWKEYRNWVQLADKGTPDRFAILEGLIIFIEVKQKGKRPSDDQIRKHQELKEKAKAFVMTVDSFEDFQAKFTNIENRIRNKSQSIP